MNYKSVNLKFYLRKTNTKPFESINIDVCTKYDFLVHYLQNVYSRSKLRIQIQLLASTYVYTAFGSIIWWSLIAKPHVHKLYIDQNMLQYLLSLTASFMAYCLTTKSDSLSTKTQNLKLYIPIHHCLPESYFMFDFASLVGRDVKSYVLIRIQLIVLFTIIYSQ